MTLRTSGYRGHTSLMHICNAIGNSLPPLYVFQGQRRVVGILAGAPEGAQYALSESGYFTEENFIHVIEFINKHTPSSPRLLILDGHTSHFAPAALGLFVAWDIRVLCLPSHTSHLLQVADLTVFGPFKKRMEESCEAYRLKHQHDINKYDIAAITCHPWNEAIKPSNVTAGFKRAGIWPLNKLAVSSDKYKLQLIDTSTASASTSPITSTCSRPVCVPFQMQSCVCTSTCTSISSESVSAAVMSSTSGKNTILTIPSTTYTKVAPNPKHFQHQSGNHAHGLPSPPHVT